MFNIFGQRVETRVRAGSPRTKKSKSKIVEVGCEHCPLNRPGLRKVKGLVRIKQRRAMLWAQSPGAEENAKGLELIGRAGQFLWEELGRFGLERDDFDVQNVIRCRPMDEDGRDEHTPTKEELRCCSIFNEEALELNQQKAVVHLILGKVAGAQLLGRNYRKDTPIFWHEPWNAYVVLADHPSYLLRLGGKKAGWVYYTFRDRLKAVKSILSYPGRYGYLKKQDYGSVQTPEEMDRLLDVIYQEAKAGRRVSVDIEDGVVADRKVPLIVGFGWGDYEKVSAWDSWKGGARSVVLDHPQAQNKKHLPVLKEKLRIVLDDPKVKKGMQNGSYDVTGLWKLLRATVKGYDFDTRYGAYLRHPHLRTYSFASMVKFFLQEFADYKSMMDEWSGNFAEAPLDRLILYNCGDCDLTKRIEAKISKHVSHSLMQVYIQVAFVLDKMQQQGPWLDRESHKMVSEVVDARLKNTLLRLRQVAGDPDFNPNTPKEVAKLLFDKLKLPRVEGNGTGKDILQMMLIKGKSKVPQLVIDYRELSKIKNTYLVGFEKSADLHAGMLHTIWWLTGAVTGRLRSGRGDKAEKEQGIINFQNLHGNPLLQNMLVSDLNWRKALAS